MVVPRDAPSVFLKPVTNLLTQNKRGVRTAIHGLDMFRLADNFGQQGIRAMLQIKTGHTLYPAKFMDEKLKEAPGGCWITMKGKGPHGTDLLSIGYTYNIKRVLKFVATSYAGSTKAGTPYDMKFCASYNNVCVRKVDQPAIVSQFFDNSQFKLH
jgi:hypothetical protein